MQGASVSTQACGRSGRQLGIIDGYGKPTDSDKSHQHYDEANRGHNNTRSRQNDGEGRTESGSD